MTRRASCQQGFVLVLTLWILAAITLAASYFVERVQRAVELAQQSQQNAQTLADLANTRAEVLFRLGTTPVSLYGLGPTPSESIFLDNRGYRGEGKSVVRMQDTRGLVNLNYITDEQLNRFLGTLDIPAERRPAMIDTLRDYMDTDNLKRLNGAEEAEYRAANLPPPRNEQLITPYEPKNIIGWRDVPQLWEGDRLPELTTTSASIGLNPNTAPWQVLATLPGVTADVAQAILARRKLAPFTSVEAVAQVIGIAPELLLQQVITLPSRSVRVTQSTPDLPWALRYNVTLTPKSARAPWRIDYYYKIGIAYKDENSEEIQPFPPRTSVPVAVTPPLLSAR